MAAGRAGHDGSVAGRTAAVGAEVGAPDEWSAAAAPNLGRAVPHDREERLELLEPAVDLDELSTAFGDEIVAKAVATVHLEDQAAKIPDALLAQLQQRSALAAQDTGRRQRAPGRWRGRTARKAGEQRSHAPPRV
jgi:hypothetical protein